MKKKTIKKLIGLFVVFCVTFGVVLVVRDHRLLDRSKPNIFEIPGTAHMHCVESLDFYRYNGYFMVQKMPKSKTEVKAMIVDFLEQNEVASKLFQRDSRATTLGLEFYVPSMGFPVYFEENKSYFEMDDFISHYTDNLFLIVTFDREDGMAFLFKDTCLERLNISLE